MVETAPAGIPTSESGLQACSEKPVLLRINPLRARPHANIRQIRSAWVRDLQAKIMEHGWSETHPVIYASVLFADIKATTLLPDDEARPVLDEMSFRILDGRIALVLCKNCRI